MKVGSIEDVVLGPDGRATAVVIGVGGFLGIGEKKVALPFDQVVWNTKAKPTDGPSASTAPNQAGARADTPPSRPERMPGAEISNEVLASTAENRSGVVNPATGPVTTGSTPPDPATVLVVGDGLAEAEIRMSRAELQQAPAFEAR